MSQAATHCRLLTPSGAGAIAVVRLEGPSALSIADQVFHPIRKDSAPIDSDDDRDALAPTGLRYGRIIVDNEMLDDAIVNFAQTTSGDTRVDFCVHGGTRIVQRLMMALQLLGAVPAGSDQCVTAWPIHNLIDADALSCLAHAQTRRAVALILRQRERLPFELERIAAQADVDEAGARAALAALVARSQPSAKLIEGAVVAIVGPPNVGKSTLANRLFGAPRSIVTPVAGTTRDWVAEPAAVRGIPITLVDTPGLRQTVDPLEALAMRRSADQWASRDLTLIVLDGSVGPMPSATDYCTPDQDAGIAAIVIVNKTDLPPAFGTSDLALPAGWRSVALSAKTGQGIDDLHAAIEAALGLSGQSVADAMLFASRQFDAIRPGMDGAAKTDDQSVDSGANLADTIRNNLLGGSADRAGPVKK